MVGPAYCLLLSLAAVDKQTLLEKLEPDRRAAVVLALVGIALLGVLLVTITMLAARWARHPVARRPPRTTDNGRETAKGDSSVRAMEEGELGETLAGKPTSNDTLDDGPGGRH